LHCTSAVVPIPSLFLMSISQSPFVGILTDRRVENDKVNSSQIQFENEYSESCLVLCLLMMVPFKLTCSCYGQSLVTRCRRYECKTVQSAG